ncbi:hypothetical protein IV102_09880 [bacterium]|nr:hypothetical protein [bacterium]
MFGWIDRWRSGRLYIRARAFLAQARYEQALQLATRLRRIGHFGAWEIEALVHRTNDRLDQATETLLEGLRIFPANQVLQNLLGLTYFHLGRFEEAEQTLECARQNGSDPDWVGYQVALIRQRQQRYEEALHACPSRPVNPEVRTEIVEMRLRLLLQLQRYEELVQELGATSEANSQSHWLGAQAYKMLGRDAQAQEQVLLALKSDFSAGPEIQALLEEVSDPVSLTCRRYAIRYEGRFRKPPRRMRRIRGGIAMAQVVADNQAEAVALYKGAEMTEIVRDFSLQRCEDRGPFPAELKGLFGSPRHIFY